MASVIPQVGQVLALTELTALSLTLKLFSNNITPGLTDVAGDYTEVTGGGYASIALVSGNWGITPGTPSVALYNAFQDFNFTGAIGGSGNVYGYYIVSGSTLVQAERLAPGDIPFTPVNGTLLRVKPRITCANA